MKRLTWVQVLVASVMIILAGVVLVAAEERIEVKVENQDGNEIKVDVNGVVEVIRLDDLADGEARTFEVGEHTLVVARAGDRLTVTSDGHAFGVPCDHGKSLDAMVWVSEDGEKIEIDADSDHVIRKKMIVVSSGDGEEGEAQTYTIRVDGDEVLLDGDLDVEMDKLVELGVAGHPHAVFIAKDGAGHHPMMFKTHAGVGDMVTYRCDETGSVLLIPKDDAIEDSYICPATGCVMSKVEESEVRVIKIHKKVEADDQ